MLLTVVAIRFFAIVFFTYNVHINSHSKTSTYFINVVSLKRAYKYDVLVHCQHRLTS